MGGDGMSGLLVHRLPDSYAKPVRGREAETATNTWRLFAVNEEQTEHRLHPDGRYGLRRRLLPEPRERLPHPEF